MAHFAEIDSSNTVLRVVVVSNEILLDENNVEDSQKGSDFCNTLLGGNWVQTSYNNTDGKKFAQIGGTFDSNLNDFISKKPYPSWTLDETGLSWEAPISHPEDDQFYVWDEATGNWKLIS